MNEYLIYAHLPSFLSKEFFSLIPAQRKRIDSLFTEKVLLNYSMSNEANKIWLTLCATNMDQVYEILAELPLMQFMKVKIHELSYLETYSNNLPQISLN